MKDVFRKKEAFDAYCLTTLWSHFLAHMYVDVITHRTLLWGDVLIVFCAQRWRVDGVAWLQKIEKATDEFERGFAGRALSWLQAGLSVFPMHEPSLGFCCFFMFFLYFFVAQKALGHSKCERKSALNTSKALSLYFELLNCRRDGNCDFLNASWSWSSYI